MARPPKGPKLARNLDGSGDARKQLEIILETVAGERTVEDACALLGVSRTAFHKMRARALQAALMEIEPEFSGRPRKGSAEGQQRVEELEEQVKELTTKLHVAHLREELLMTMPEVFEPAKKALKKREKLQRQRESRRKRRKGKRPSGGTKEGT